MDGQKGDFGKGIRLDVGWCEFVICSEDDLTHGHFCTKFLEFCFLVLLLFLFCLAFD